MTALVYGFVRAASEGWSDGQAVAAFVTAAVLLTAFVVVELRVSSPITPLRLFADRTRASALAGRVLLVAAMFGMFFYLTQILQDVYGYTPLVTGLAFLPLTVMLFVMSRISAGLMERVGMRALMVGGLAISTTGILLLTRLTTDSGYVSVLVPLLLFGTGNGLAFVPLTAAGLAGVEPRDAGAASGLVNVAQQVGGSVGLAVLVTVGAAGARHAHPVGTTPAEIAQHAFVAGADRAFLVSALLLAATVVLLAVATPSLHAERMRRLARAIDEELEAELELAEAVTVE
jgi:predicted MFS family arabinose efflux permease